MKKHKQLLTDILVVIGIPLGIVLTYHFYFATPIQDDSLLSLDSASIGMATPGSSDLGSQTKEILNTLNSINFDTTFFSDPAFLSLQDFTPVYVATATGRPYPFTLPEDIQSLVDKSKQSAVPTSDATSVSQSQTTKSTTKK